MMRPNTRSSGIFNTKRRSPVSTSRLTRMLVPKPKNAFQSPGVHHAGLLVAILFSLDGCKDYATARTRERRSGHRRNHPRRIRYPAEDAALRLDHRQADGVKFRKVGSAAVARHDAA